FPFYESKLIKRKPFPISAYITVSSHLLWLTWQTHRNGFKGMDALVSVARAGMHAQATVRRKCPASQNTKAGDIGGLKSIKSEALMGFDSILTTSPLVKAGSRGSPLGKKNPQIDLYCAKQN
ncbi:MAG: hypothetical protein R3309_06415, partial [Reinekea sp.]|nr:hypothetical protein [Reinekea sp.]